MATPAQARARSAKRIHKREQIVDGFLSPQNRVTLLAALDALARERAAREIVPLISLDLREFKARVREYEARVRALKP